MKSGLVRWLFVIAAVLAVPALGFAQEATITGIVTDATGGVLPGVTVTAVHEATGNTFVGVTDERGVYRIGARIGEIFHGRRAGHVAGDDRQFGKSVAQHANRIADAFAVSMRGRDGDGGDPALH